MTEKTRLSGEHVTELQLELAKQELLTLAHEYARTHGCSLLIAMGMVDAELRQKIANQRSIGRP